MSSWITDIQTPDKYTVVLGTDQPRPSLFDYLQFVNISDPETYAGPNSSTKVVGTGPFEFVEWIQGDHVTLRKNAKYWRSGVPLLDEQQFMILRDPQAMVAQLEAGAPGRHTRNAAALRRAAEGRSEVPLLRQQCGGYLYRARGKYHAAAAGPHGSAPGHQLRPRSEAHCTTRRRSASRAGA